MDLIDEQPMPELQVSSSGRLLRQASCRGRESVRDEFYVEAPKLVWVTDITSTGTVTITADVNGDLKLTQTSFGQRFN